MNFFIKLFKALNSAQKPWQITLAVVLGMLMGLTPLSGIQTLFILLIAFVVNIHLSFFFIMAAQFAAIGYLFDGMFDAFGFYLLTLESLQDIWTTMYNSGLMRLTYFNNTIVIGSTVAALILTLPLYFVISKLLHVYRVRIATFCSENKWLNKFGFFDRPDKKEKAIRVWGLGAFVISSILVTLIVIMFLDSWVKMGLEKGLGIAFDKQVHIENLELSFSDASLNIQALSVSGSRSNEAAVVMGNIHANLDFNAILLGKTHIEKIAVTQMKFNQKTDLFQALADQKTQELQDEEQSKAKEKKKVSEPKKEASVTNTSLPSVDDVIKNSKLGSQKAYEIAKTEMDTISNKWKEQEKTLAKDSTLKEIENDFNALQTMTKHLKLQDLKKFKQTLDAFNSKVNKQKHHYAQLVSDFNTDKNRIGTLIKTVEQANKNDKQSIKDKYTLSGQGGVNLLGTFLGPKVQSYLQTALEVYAKVSPYLESEETNTTTIDRHKGRTITFKEHTPQADLLISLVELSGKFKGQTFQASIHDISDNQRLINKAITFSLLSDGPKAKKFKLKGVDDRRSKVAKDYIKVSIEKVPNMAFDLGVVTLHNSNMSLFSEITLLDQKTIKGYSKSKFSKSDLTAGSIGGSLGQSINEDLAEVKYFYANVKLKGSLSQPNISVKSDLSQYLKNSLNRYVDKQVAAFESELSRKLDAMTKDKLVELGLVNKDFAKQGSQLSNGTNQLNILNKKAAGLKANPAKKLKSIKNIKDLKNIFKF